MKTITIEDVNNAILKEEYITLGVKTAVCILTLKNGFEIIGTSAAVDPNNYSLEVGKPYAKSKALDKVWELEGYLLQSKLND